MTKVCVLVLIGLPACGKTTFANLLKEILTGAQQPFHSERIKDFLSENITCVNVCYDLVVPDENVTNEMSESWKQRRLDVVHCVECLLNQFMKIERNSASTNLDGESPSCSLDMARTEVSERFSKYIYPDGGNGKAPNDKVVIIIDDNMYYSSMRYEYYQIARENNVGFAELYIECSEMEAASNNAQRDRQVLKDVISRMAHNLEPPGKEQWEKFSLTVKNTTVLEEKTVNQVLDLISQSWENPVEKLMVCDPAVLQASRQTCSRSLLHQVDLILRQLVGQHMKGSKVDKDSRKRVARQLANTKATILRDVEKNEITIAVSDRDIENAAEDSSCELYRIINSIFQSQLENLTLD